MALNKSFKEIVEAVKALPKKPGIAVVMAQDEHTLIAVSEAVKEGLVAPYLIGDVEGIEAILAQIGEDKANYTIIAADGVEDSMACAAKLVNDGTCSLLMKGKLETGQIMKGVLKAENDLRGSGIISIMGYYECPNYHKMFGVTDVGMNVYPDLNAKKGILENAVDALHKLGVECPKVGVLAAVEKLNPKMKETVDADELKQMNQRGEITGCIVEGPISLDLAMIPESAELKGYESPVSGDCDLLVCPDLCSGNLLVKALTELGGTETGGTVIGAKVPIVLVSRAAKSSDKFNSIAVAAYLGSKR